MAIKTSRFPQHLYWVSSSCKQYYDPNQGLCGKLRTVQWWISDKTEEKTAESAKRDTLCSTPGRSLKLKKLQVHSTRVLCKTPKFSQKTKRTLERCSKFKTRWGTQTQHVVLSQTRGQSCTMLDVKQPRYKDSNLHWLLKKQFTRKCSCIAQW